MRAVVARDRRLIVDDVAEPVPGPGEVLVAVRACGICGSDLHTLEHSEHLVEVGAALGTETGFDPRHDYVLGHEWSAEVLELGPEPDDPAGIAPVPVGDLVVSVPYLLRGDAMLPLGFTNDAPGGFAERMLLTAALCVPVPNGLDHRRAALTEPMAVGLHTLERAGLHDGDAAVVIGCGPIGLAIIAWLVARGVEPIVAADFSPVRRALASQIGAHEVVDPREEPVVEAWRRVDGLRPLVLFEAVGVPGMLDQAVFDAPARSRIVVAGVCMQPDTFRPLLAVVKELDFHFVYAYGPEEFTATLRAIAEGEVDVSPLVTGHVGFDGVADAFTRLRRVEDHVKILVEPDGPARTTEIRV
ncbi:MAG TPA: zinc-binding dehydrogenase [Acidimicrobiia bacterium]|nr:zinc-binding dehydrogenase [Acidimicrobiia bacterium]